MAVKFGFFDSLGGDRLYNTDDINHFFDGIFSDGVFELSGNGLRVENSPGTMNVLVRDGRAWFNSLWIRNTSTLTLAISESHLTLNRIDIVILEFDSTITIRTNSIKVLTGTPASVPIPPTLTNSGTVHQYALAHVYIPAGVSSLVSGNVTNKIGTVATPYARSLVSTPLSTALHDFQLGDGIGGWMKKTSSETVSILRTFLDTIYLVGGREVLTENRTYYVRTNGNDTNDGLSNTSTGAFLTIQKAIDTISTLDVNGKTVTIQVGDGTYTTPITLKNIVGYSTPGTLIINGNISNPNNVVISTNSSSIVKDGSGSVWDIQNLKITTTSGHSIYTLSGGYIRFQNIIFGSASAAHLRSTSGGIIVAIGNYQISGGGYIHAWADANSIINISSRTIAFSNSPIFTYFVVFEGSAFIMAWNMTFTNGGTVTGQKYLGTLNGAVQTNGSTSYFPGTIAGVLNTGSQYA